jgi:hypothetical protein
MIFQEWSVRSAPFDSAHKASYNFRTKALQHRHDAPYTMDVLSRFWLHFLTQNFNTRMCDGFRHFAFEDATTRRMDTRVSVLEILYVESLSLLQSVMRVLYRSLHRGWRASLNCFQTVTVRSLQR